MSKVLLWLKSYWVYLVPLVGVLFLIPLLKKWFGGDGSQDRSGSDYLADQLPDEVKGVIVGSDGLEYFRYGNKRVRLTEGNKAKVVQYVDLLYQYLSVNTNSMADWLLNDALHFYTGEVQMALNDYNRWNGNQVTWMHYFAYVWLVLHDVPFLDYLKSKMDGEGYDATRCNVPYLGYFYY